MISMVKKVLREELIIFISSFNGLKALQWMVTAAEDLLFFGWKANLIDKEICEILVIGMKKQVFDADKKSPYNKSTFIIYICEVLWTR